MAKPHQSTAALQERNFLLFFTGSLVAMIGRQMLTVAIGWDIYEKTGSALALGFIGLVQFMPVLLLTLPAGHIVDNYDRRKVLIIADILGVLGTLGLFWNSLALGSVPVMYVCMGVMGVARAFTSPAHAAFMPQVVSEGNFTNAVTWSSMAFQLAAVLGPAIGGLLLGVFHHAAPVYLIDFLSCLVFWILLLKVRGRKVERPRQAVSMKSLFSGVVYIWRTRIILAALTLDMFAVLFGGAIALLPIYAKDILHVGPEGLGWLQAAPSMGAILMGLVIARKAVFRNSGTLLLWSVIGFGLATIGFGLSRNFWLSLAMLFLTGLFDCVSMVIRHSLVQLRTPDEMRGRVSAINYIFIGTSNELGGFESGVLANWRGPVFSVVFGGVATIVTVVATGLIWPELRRMDRLEADREEAEPVVLPTGETQADLPAARKQ